MTRHTQVALLGVAVCAFTGCSGAGEDENNQNQNLNNQSQAVCGDGIRQGVEECDDGAANSDTAPDACRTDCRLARCGDGVVDDGEACDDGPQNSDTEPNTCRVGCVDPHCGDGVIDTGEVCDDGDTQPGDGCGPECIAEVCGNGSVDAGEVCDDANTNDGDGCSSNCRSDETCGNGTVDLAKGEACDEGALNTLQPNADCRPDCQLPRCGDGILDDLLGEHCDDGLGNSDAQPDACRTSCVPASCGDGVLDTAELCDDGNAADGDGCSGLCDRFEYGWNCSPTTPHGCIRCPTYLHGPACDQCAVLVDLLSPATTQDGSSWASAFHDVQAGIDAAAARAVSLGRVCEVWVAEGRYYLFETSADDTVRLRDGVSVFGGFSGRELSRAERDWRGRPTVLHGGDGLGVNQVYHVVSAEDVTTAVLDGFTVTGGWARDVADDGGGLHLVGSTVTLTNLLVAGNRASGGAGMYLYASSPLVSGCNFVDNEATSAGGGAYVSYESSPTFDGCVFSGNQAGSGAALYENSSNGLTVRRSTFVGGVAGSGGAFFTSLSSPQGSRAFESCVLVGNNAGGYGGAFHAYSSYGYDPSAGLDLLHCTAALNTASAFGGGLYATSYQSSYAIGRVRSSVLWGNQASVGGDLYRSTPGTLTLSTSDIGSYYGVTLPADCLSTDPLFLAVPSPTGSWASVTYDDQAFQTTLQVATDSWAPDALVGRFLRPDDRDPRWFLIVANTSRTITVWSDIPTALLAPPLSPTTPYDPPFGAGSDFTLFDARLAAPSPCIDTANSAVAPATDLLGNPRQDGPDADFVAQPDMGAYEYQP